jgi:hypothetical protein
MLARNARRRPANWHKIKIRDDERAVASPPPALLTANAAFARSVRSLLWDHG